MASDDITSVNFNKQTLQKNQEANDSRYPKFPTQILKLTPPI